jgi:hypothetical protein
VHLHETNMNFVLPNVVRHHATRLELILLWLNGVVCMYGMG